MPNVTIKLDNDTIQKLAIFESITRTSLRDCIEEEEEILFVINNKDLGKAIGKGASNIKLLQRKFNKKILLIGFDSDPKLFARNLFKPIPIKNINLTNNILNIMIVGNQRAFPSKKVKKAKMLLKKYFNNIDDVKVKV